MMRIATLLFLSFLIFSEGCNNSQPSENQEAITSDLIGRVSLRTARGNIASDKRGVKIECEGTTFAGYSDSLGNWVIHNLPTRTYSILFSKDGYVPRRNNSFSFIAGVTGGFQQNMELTQAAEYTIVLDSVHLPYRKYFDSLKKDVSISGFIKAHSSSDVPDSASIGVLCVFSFKNNIEAPINYPPLGYTVSRDYNGRYPNPVPWLINEEVSISWRDAHPLNSGDSLYCRAFPYVSLYSDRDAITGNSILSGLGGGSNTLLVIVP